MREGVPASAGAPPWFATRAERWTFWGLLGVALVLRLITLVQASSAPYYDAPILDSAVYDQWGQEIAKGRWIGGEEAAKRALNPRLPAEPGVFYQDPLYPYFLGILYAVFGRSMAFTRLAQIAVGLASCALVYAAGRRMFGRVTATIALAAAAAYKPFLFYDTLLLKTFLEVFFLLLATWFLLRAEEAARGGGGRRWLFLAGLALGVGALARATFLLIAAALVVWLRVALPAEGWRGAARRWGWIALGALAGVAPATLHNAVAGGEFILTTAQGGPNFYTGNHPGNQSGRYKPPPFVYGNPLSEARDWRAEAERRAGRTLSAGEVDRYWWRQGLAYAWRNPLLFAEGLARKFVLFWHAAEYPDQEDLNFMARFMPVLAWPLPAYAIVSPLGLLGLAIALRERRRHALPILLLAVYAGSVMMFFLFARYRLAAVPFLILFAAYAVAWSAEQMLREEPQRTALAVAGGIALFVGASIVGTGGMFGDLEAWGFGPFRPTAAHFNLGTTYIDRGEYELARVEFNRVLELQPEWGRAPDAHVNLAAIALQEAATAADAPRQGSGQAAARDRALAEARRHLDAALVLSPGFAPALWRLGNWAHLRGDLGAAIAYLEKALALRPDLTDARLNLAEVHVARGDAAAATEALEAVLRVEPCRADALFRLGQLAVEAGDRSRGRDFWKKAAACDDRNVLARLHLMRLAVRESAELAARRDMPGAAGALREAAAYAQDVLRLDPGNAAAREVMERIARSSRGRR